MLRHRLRRGLRAVHDGDLARSQVRQLARAGFQENVQPVHAGRDPSEIHVQAPAGVRVAEFRLGREHVLPSPVHGGLPHQFAIAVHMYAGGMLRRAARHIRPAGHRQRALGESVDVFREAAQGLRPDVARRGNHLVERGVVGADHPVELRDAPEFGAQVAAEALDGSRAVIGDPIATTESHPGLKIRKQMVQLAQKRDAADFRAVFLGKPARRVHHGPDRLDSALGQRIARGGEGPVEDLRVVVIVHAQRAVARLPHVRRIGRQDRLDGGLGREVRREQIQNGRTGGVPEGSHQAVHDRLVDLPATTLRWLEQLEQGYRQRIAQVHGTGRLRRGLQCPQSGFHQRSCRTLRAAALALHLGETAGQGRGAPDARLQHSDHRCQQHARRMRRWRLRLHAVQEADPRDSSQEHGGSGCGHGGARQDRSGRSGRVLGLHAFGVWARGLRL